VKGSLGLFLFPLTATPFPDFCKKSIIDMPFSVLSKGLTTTKETWLVG
jgi:hypothetical protein